MDRFDISESEKIIKIFTDKLHIKVRNKILETEYNEYDSECNGHIYILKHPYESDMYKIGRTIRSPMIRSKEQKYKLLWSRRVKTNVRFEKIVHLHLFPFHRVIKSINGKGKVEREWFNLPLNVLTSIISNLIIHYDNIIFKNHNNLCGFSEITSYFENRINSFNNLDILRSLTIKDLREIYGRKSILASRIIKYMNNNQINHIDDLLNIKEIGPARLFYIKQYVALNTDYNTTTQLSETSENNSNKDRPNVQSDLEFLLSLNIINLRRINGIGPVLSERIYNYINKNRIYNIDDLLKINGIGPVKLLNIREYIQTNTRQLNILVQ